MTFFMLKNFIVMTPYHVKFNSTRVFLQRDSSHSFRDPQPNNGDEKQQPSPVSPQPVLDKPGPSLQNKEGVMSDAELQQLRELLQQRDNEINVLLKILKQERRRANEAESALKEAGLAVERKRPPSPILGRTSPLWVDGPVPESLISMVSLTNNASSQNTVGSAVSLPSSQSRLSSAVTTTEWRHSSGAATTATASTATGGSCSTSGVVDSRDWSAMKAGIYKYSLNLMLMMNGCLNNS